METSLKRLCEAAANEDDRVFVSRKDILIVLRSYENIEYRINQLESANETLVSINVSLTSELADSMRELNNYKRAVNNCNGGSLCSCSANFNESSWTT